MRVIKRDGTIQQWDFAKIESAINKAFLSVIQEDESSLDEIQKFIDYIKPIFEKFINNKDEVNVEDIHDILQKELIRKNKYKVVDNFIRWRKDREEQREANSELIKDIQAALSASNVQNQNANVDEASFGGRIGEAARVVCKKAALRNMRKQTRKNHESNEVYTHSLKIVA